jgi:hypothetical protein
MLCVQGCIFNKPNDLRTCCRGLRDVVGPLQSKIQPFCSFIHSFFLLVLVLVLLEVLTDGLHSKSWGECFFLCNLIDRYIICSHGCCSKPVKMLLPLSVCARIYSTSQMIWGTCCRGLREVVGPLQSKLQPFCSFIHSFFLLVFILVLLEVLTDGLHSKSWGSVFLSAIS